MGNMPILTIRAEALQSSLSKISQHLASVPDRRKDLTELDRRIDQMRDSLFALAKKVSNAKIHFLIAADSVRRKVMPQIDVGDIAEAEEQVQRFIEELSALQQIVAGMRDKCFDIQDAPIGAGIDTYLTNKTRTPIQELRQLDVNLKQRAPDRDSWQTFSVNATQPSQQLFVEYIEFLGGLALRDTGFDEGICKLADDLLKTYYTKPQKSSPMLAIPTRRQTVAMTLARIIRVTFPDWTIWALPSTAREFWHVVAHQEVAADLDFELSQLSGVRKDAAEPRFNECLADAFATYTMGPAYAYLAVYQLLNPAAAHSTSPEYVGDELRAQAIIEMLARMDSKENRLAPPYHGVRAGLEAVWADAVAQAWPPVLPPKARQRRRPKPVAHAKTDSTQAEVEAQAKAEAAQARTEADRPRTILVVEALSSALDKIEFQPFTVDIWNEVESWVDPLVKGQVDKIQIPSGAELRHVLNAAWRARVRTDRPPDDVLTQAAAFLASKVLNPAPVEG